MRNKVIFKAEMVLSALSLILIGLNMFNVIDLDWKYVLMPIIVLGGMRNALILAVMIMNLIELMSFKKNK